MQTLPPNLLNLSRHYRMQRNVALAALGLPEGVNTDIQQWAEVERLAKLSDVELCLLALLRSDLTPPPFIAEEEEMTRWFNELAALASNLRTEIREACEARTSS